jgi:hypothetical protein
LYLGGWAESEAGQWIVSGKAAAQLSSTRWAAQAAKEETEIE